MLFPNLDFLYIQAGFGCVSNCSSCNKAGKAPMGMDEEIIKSNINTLINSSIFSGNLFIYNRECTSYSQDFCMFVNSLSGNFKNIYYHTSFYDFSYNHGAYIGRKCIYQRDIDDIKEQQYICTLLSENFSKLPESIFVLWYEKKESLYVILKFLQRYFSNISLQREPNGGYYMTVDDKTFRILPKKGERKNLDMCFFQKSISFGEEQVFIDSTFFPSSGFEITHNKKIRIHELPCGIGDIVVSSIDKSLGDIKKDFQAFEKYINTFIETHKLKSQTDICNLCNSKRYTYE